MAIIFFRTLIIFSTLLLLMRILGKRQMGELEPSELVVSVLIADLASMPLQDIGIPLLNGLVPIVILFACELIIAGLTMRSVKLRAVICGKPCMLIKNGKIIQENMRVCRFTVTPMQVTGCMMILTWNAFRTYYCSVSWSFRLRTLRQS